MNENLIPWMTRVHEAQTTMTDTPVSALEGLLNGADRVAAHAARIEIKNRLLNDGVKGSVVRRFADAAVGRVRGVPSVNSVAGIRIAVNRMKTGKVSA